MQPEIKIFLSNRSATQQLNLVEFPADQSKHEGMTVNMAIITIRKERERVPGCVFNQPERLAALPTW